MRVRTASHLFDMVSESSMLRLVMTPSDESDGWSPPTGLTSLSPTLGRHSAPAVSGLPCFVDVHSLARVGQRTSHSSCRINTIMEVRVGGNFVSV